MLDTRFNRSTNLLLAVFRKFAAAALCLSVFVGWQVSAAEKQIPVGAGEARILPYSFTPMYYLPADGKSLLAKDYPVLQSLFLNQFGEAAEGEFVMPKLAGLSSPKGRLRVSIETRRGAAKSLVESFRATALKVSDHVAQLEQAVADFSRINAGQTGKPGKPGKPGKTKDETTGTSITTKTSELPEHVSDVSKAVQDSELFRQSFDAISTVKALDAAIGMSSPDAGSLEEKRIDKIVAVAMRHSLALKKSLDDLAARTDAALKMKGAELNIEQAAQLKAAREKVVVLQEGFKSCHDSLAELDTQYQDSVFTPKSVNIPMAIAINGVNQDPLIGEIRLYACNYAPRGWLPCDGRTLPVNRYNALSMLLGDQFGGDGKTTFALPKMSGPIAKSKSHLQYHIATTGFYPRTGNQGVGVDKAGYSFGDNMLSEVRLMPYATAPRGWLPCDGRTMPIAKNKSLYALLGKAFGGDGRKTFKLPKLEPVKTGNGEYRYYIVVQGSWPARN